MREMFPKFTTKEIIFWIFSVSIIIVTFLVFDRTSYLTLTASVIGVTSIIINAKGSPLGQLLMIVFSILYGIISFGYSYYGEMITYLGMTGPMAALAFVAWIRHPFQGKKSEVAVNKITKREWCFTAILTIVVTVVFSFILAWLGTANLLPSTISVTTSFVAVYLVFRRCELFNLAYAANDIVLIVLWVMATLDDIHYVSTVACFVAFLMNDIYAYISWRRMKARQNSIEQGVSL